MPGAPASHPLTAQTLDPHMQGSGPEPIPVLKDQSGCLERLGGWDVSHHHVLHVTPATACSRIGTEDPGVQGSAHQVVPPNWIQQYIVLVHPDHS